MDFQQYLLALQARRKVFLLVFAAILVTAVTVALVLPKRYDATATVLLDARDEQGSAGAGRVSPRERAGWVYTQVDLIQSGKVANRVARELKLAQQPGVREQFESETGGVGTIEDWLGATLLEKLKVDTGASNVLIIKYSSGDAAKSAAVANAFAKAYLETALEMRTEPSREAADWFEEQLGGHSLKVHSGSFLQTNTQMADVLHQATEALKKAIGGLRDFGRPRRILDYCIEINRLENQGDRVLEMSLGKLFDRKHDPIDVI
jgi:uncharacterized protein involved in exopolysaccharide biosynthesis